MKKSNDDLLNDLLNEVENCDIIIELGSNIGSITTKLLKYNKKVYAFEPEPVAFDKLQQLQNDNLIISNNAAWIKNEKLFFYRHKDWEVSQSHTSSSLISTKNNIDNRNKITVNAINIVEFIEQFNCRILIKMDIEGAEYKIINKLLKSKSIKNITKIFCEFHPTKIKYGKILHIITILHIYLRRKSTLFVNWF
jgi:FkbM family methyltransferase